MVAYQRVFETVFEEKQLNWLFTKWSLSRGVRLREEVVAVRPVRELTAQTPSYLIKKS